MESEPLPPEDEEEEPRGRFNKRLLVGLGVVVLAAAYLLFLSLNAASALYLEVDQLTAPGNDVQGRRLRVAGTVAPDSVVRDGGGLQVQFTLRGQSTSIPVVYKGAVPDIFGEGVTVFAEGTYGGDGIFSADVLLARHPDTMQPLQEGDTKPPAEY
ncbi:MAG: cytochrome c maturation protein CcmE [Chloroflexi bacterium]|nr:cytochrome c maturation protein CcmE [Chloroflexota bacterium]